ncbi:DUF4242 domain-containing protein [Micrococcales bacterium 31B]|nr:DUF4242 domain-containing protein [Micrococcales bacterium 31B]
MSLFLYEATPAEATAAGVKAAIAALGAGAAAAGGEFIEAQVAESNGRVFAIVEYDADQCDAEAPLAQHLSVDALTDITELVGPDQVRLVGADLDQIKAARPSAEYLVEWQLPDGLDMDSYLARKKEKSPKYAEIPEVSFLRTYVREDMDKCLCFYDAPDEDAVVRARAIVDTPFDRLTKLSS